MADPNSIVLSAGVQSNLLSLQNTNDLFTQINTRLSTGKKVNSALDNATNFFLSNAFKASATTYNTTAATTVGQILNAINTTPSQTIKASLSGSGQILLEAQGATVITI